MNDGIIYAGGRSGPRRTRQSASSITACSTATACSKASAPTTAASSSSNDTSIACSISAGHPPRIPLPRQDMRGRRRDLPRNGISDGYIRLVVTRGAGDLGLDPGGGRRGVRAGRGSVARLGLELPRRRGRG